MDPETESDPSSKPKLPLFSLQPISSPEPSGTLTPPLQTSASVPFLWEEEPGKPRPCTALITLPNPKCLELPPRLLAIEPKFTKTPSPTTVLDGPYMAKKALFSSLRLTTERQMSLEKFGVKGKGKGIMGKGRNKEVSEGSLVFSPSMEVAGLGVNGRVRRNGSLSQARSHSHLWTTIYEGFRHVISWKGSKKCRKERLNIVV